jgi:hypothetical protein
MCRNEVEDRLVAVLKIAERWLPREQLIEMGSLVRAGEPGVALENLCTQLEEYDVAVPRDVLRELREIASAMRMKISPWLERFGYTGPVRSN